jgi:phosphoadenosine phosphosulfate reductase
MFEFAQPSATPVAPVPAFTSSAPPAKTPDVSRRETAAQLAGDLAPLDLLARLAAIREHIAGRVVFTTSFGLEDQAIAHAIFAQNLAIDVVTLDTGRLFPETHQVWAATEERYATRIAVFAPDNAGVEALLARQGIDGFRSSVAARLDCCTVRKVTPLARALAGSAGWVTGIRADQSAARAQFAAASFDEQRALIKANPLFDWSRERTLAFVRANHIPYNALHDRGFLSIGCAPCTRAVAQGEPERAGRWWWEQEDKKECGLHVVDGRLVRAAAPAA